MTDQIDGLSFTDAQVSAFRLRRHHLDRRAPRSSLPRVVGDVVGVQTQVTIMARIALWARVQGLTVGDVQRALEDERTIVKTWSMRGALHLHRSNELPFILGGMMARRLPLEQKWIHRVGLKEEETTTMVLKALEDGPLTRAQLAEYLAKRLGDKTKDWMDGGWGRKTVGSSNAWYLVQPAMYRGLVCFGPSDGQEITFVRMDQWLGKSLQMPAEAEAEEALVRRYLRSFGPADVYDVMAWSRIHVRRIRAIVERLRDELVEVDRDGHPGFLLGRDLSDLEGESDLGVARLLPSFDPFVLGHHDRSHLVNEAHYRQVYKDQGWLAPVVLVDGRVAGTWSYQRKPRTLEVRVQMFTSFSRETRRKVEDEASDLSRFLETPNMSIRFAE